MFDNNHRSAVTAKSVTFRIGCYAYPTSTYNLASQLIKFDNVPIY